MKRILLLFSMAVMAEIPELWLRAIPDDPLAVTGIDVVRFRASDLRNLQRLDIPLEDTDAIQYMVHVETHDGDFFLLRINDPVSKEIRDDYVLVPFDKETAVLGHTRTVTEAIERMQGTHECSAPIRALANRFDAWAYAPRVIRERTKGIAPMPGRFEFELFGALRAVRAGVRFGTTVEARVEIDTKDADQASALAVLGKLAPGWLQNRDTLIEFSWINAIERFTTWAEGATVVAEATIPVSAFQNIVEPK